MEKTVFQKIGDAVVDFAPGIATILAATGVGAPIAGAVGAVGALGKALGLGSNPEPEDILKAVTTDPEIRLKAMIAENDYKLKQREQEIEELRLTLADVQSARTRQVETERVTGKKDTNLYILAWWCILAPVGVLSYLIYEGLPKMAPEVALMIGGFIGIIIGEYKTITQYFFGSSRGSAEKSEQLAQVRRSLGK